MEKEESQHREITRLTGQRLSRRDWSSSELSTLLSLAPAKPAPSVPLHIPPSTSRLTLKDPRLREPSYIQLLWENPQRLESLNLHHHPLSVIAAFEGTLVSILPEIPSTYSRIILDSQVESISGTVKRIEGERLLVAERKGATEMLHGLKEVAEVFLVAKGNFVVVRKALEALGWTHIFQDVVADTTSKSLLSCFPRLSSSPRSALTLIFDDQLTSWQADHSHLLIPSLRFLALEQFASRTDFPRFETTYNFDENTTYTESVPFGEWGKTMVGPDCSQLSNVLKLVRNAAYQLFGEQYTRPASAVWREAVGQKWKGYVSIRDAGRKKVAKAAMRRVGVEEVEETKAEKWIVDDCPDEIPTGVGIYPFSSLIRSYFNLAENR